METAFLPMMLAMLLGFSMIGAVLGSHAILRARGRFTAAAIFLAMSAGLALLQIVLPFAFVASSRVSAAGFLMIVMAGVSAIAGLGGTLTGTLYCRTESSAHGLSSASFFLAAGSFPLVWCLLAERMSMRFHVGWIN